MNIITMALALYALARRITINIEEIESNTTSNTRILQLQENKLIPSTSYYYDVINVIESLFFLFCHSIGHC
jgi:hypothetical protein